VCLKTAYACRSLVAGRIKIPFMCLVELGHSCRQRGMQRASRSASHLGACRTVAPPAPSIVARTKLLTKVHVGMMLLVGRGQRNNHAEVVWMTFRIQTSIWSRRLSRYSTYLIGCENVAHTISQREAYSLGGTRL
jgi:hypothetical protein